MNTKLLALTYSAWSEAQFTQIVYTPNIFTETEIIQLLKNSGIFNKWKMLINLSFEYKKKFDKQKHLNILNLIKKDKQNNWIDLIQEENENYESNSKLATKRKDEIINYLEKYIDKQSKVRNKIAHGQWINGLKVDNTDLDIALTEKIQNLNVVDIMIEFEVHKTLGKIIRELVQSPNNSFNNNYQKYIDELNEFLLHSSSWKIVDKKNILRQKKKRIICETCQAMITKQISQ